MREILLLGGLLAICLFPLRETQAQAFEEGQLWKTSGVYEPSGKKVKAKFEQFAYAAGPLTLYLLNIDEDLNLSTGEVDIVFQVDTFRLSPRATGDSFKPSHRPDISVIRHGKDSMRFVYEKYAIGFSLVEDAIPSPTLTKVEKKLIDHTFEEHREGGTKSGIEETFAGGGVKKFKSIGTGEEWSSAYRFVPFADFILIKGVTKAPILVTEVKTMRVLGVKLDHRYAPCNVELRRK